MSNTVQLLEEYWTKHPAWFGRSYGEYLHLGANQETVRVLLHNVEIGEDWRVLDLSCALGGNARWLASLFGCTVEGVDAFRPAVVVARQLAKAQGIGGKCRFSVAKADSLPFSEGQFDLAVTAEGDVHWEEVRRVLKPESVLIGSTVAPEGMDAVRAAHYSAGFAAEEMLDVTPYAVAFYRAKEAEAKLLVDAGMMTEESLHALQMHTVDLYEAAGAAHVLFRVRAA